MAGIMAKTKLIARNPPKESLVNRYSLSFSESVCICRKISSPSKCRLLFQFVSISLIGMQTIGIIIAQISQRLFFSVEKFVLKSFVKSQMQSQEGNPNITSEPIACMHNFPECVRAKSGSRYLKNDIKTDAKEIDVIKIAIDINIFTIGDDSFVSNFIELKI
jgi:hypothetical protein